MLAKRLASLSVIATSVLAAGLISFAADAAPNKPVKADAEKGDKASAEKSGEKGKADKGKDPKAKDGKAGEKGKDAQPDATVDEKKDEPAEEKEEGVVEAGEPSQQMAAARKQFNGKNWLAASEGFYRVVSGESGDDKGNKQLAQYFLAISLYNLQFFEASFINFKIISSNKNHLKFKETLLWLAKLSTQLPEPAGIISVVGKYSEEEVARFNNNDQRDLYWQLNYMLGRHNYTGRQSETAIRLFQKVGRESKFYIPAQFYTGVSYVNLRKSIPAVQAFQRVEKAIAEGAPVDDPGRMRDLAFLSMARTYYSASVTIDSRTDTPRVNAERLSAAVKYWNRVDTGSEYWLDALFEESWAYFMAGDYPRALGNVHTIQSPYFPAAFYPETDILKAMVYFSNCNYQAARIVVARFLWKYKPIAAELDKIKARFKGESKDADFYEFLLKVRAGNANLPASVKGIVEISLSDRELLRHIEYVKHLDKEIARYQASPASFRSSPFGEQIKGLLKGFRKKAVERAGELASKRFERTQKELGEQLRNGTKINIDITAAERAKLNKKLAQEMAKKRGANVTADEAKIFGVVKPDEEHILWPFDGEYWRDELGFYRQVVESSCGK